MKIKILRNTILPLIVVCSVWNQEFKNPWINAFCKNHGNWCQRMKVFSQYMSLTHVFITKLSFDNYWLIHFIILLLRVSEGLLFNVNE